MEGVSKLFRKSGKRAKPSSALPEGLCRQFSLAKIKIATNNLNDELLVGEGGFGRVYKGFIDDCNKTVAIKRLKLKPGQGLVFEDSRTEVVLLSQLRHPNLVPFIGYCIDEGENILVYEFIVNGNLYRKLYYTDHNEHDRLSWKQRLRESCEVVAFPANILLNGKWEAKLSDFKSSKMIPSAPECFNIYMDIATSWVQNEGKDRPTMNEVEVGLKHALELQESADAESKDGEYYCPIDEYTCNDFSGFASTVIVEYTSSSSLPELEEFLLDSDSLREYI
uniref:Protein kinase domain-containing protein n=1 Tax=Quercus lobata TaxID=97700 RepID=A0A7N2LS93_QUELO